MGPLLTVLLACSAPASAETWAGQLVPRWWGNVADPTAQGQAALVLRLDTPKDGRTELLYALPENAAPEAAACLNGHIELSGRVETTDFPHVDGRLADVSVIACTPSLRPADVPQLSDIEITGTLERRWWYGSPGYGASPATDRMNLDVVLLVGGVVVPLVLPKGTVTPEFWKRIHACEGKPVRAKGRYRPAKNPLARPPYVMDATEVGTCASN